MFRNIYERSDLFDVIRKKLRERELDKTEEDDEIELSGPPLIDRVEELETIAREIVPIPAYPPIPLLTSTSDLSEVISAVNELIKRDLTADRIK